MQWCFWKIFLFYGFFLKCINVRHLVKILQKIWSTYDIWLSMCIRWFHNKVVSFFRNVNDFGINQMIHTSYETFFLRFNRNSKILSAGVFLWKLCLVYVLTRDWTFLRNFGYLIVIIWVYVKFYTLKFFLILLKYYCNLLSISMNSQTINSLVWLCSSFSFFFKYVCIALY